MQGKLYYQLKVIELLKLEHNFNTIRIYNSINNKERAQ